MRFSAMLAEKNKLTGIALILCSWGAVVFNNY